MTFPRPGHWQAGADEVLRQALVNLLRFPPRPARCRSSRVGRLGIPAPPRRDRVTAGPRGRLPNPARRPSASPGLTGEGRRQGVTVIDDGTIGQRAAPPHTGDDEGTPTPIHHLITEVMASSSGYLQDPAERARLMGMKPTVPVGARFPSPDARA